MNIKDNTLIIKGCIPYKTKREKLIAFRDLRREFGDTVKMIFKDNLIYYSIKTDRSLYL